MVNHNGIARHNKTEKHQEWLKSGVVIKVENNKNNNKPKIECGCGSVVGKSDITRHNKTKKHQEWLKNQN